MKSKELRVGILFHPIDRTGEVHLTVELPHKVAGYYLGAVRGYRLDEMITSEVTLRFFNLLDMSPIPTTEKWLRDFGFEGTQFLIAKGNFTYQIENKTLAWFGVMLHNSLWNEVHKLQNLVFALTGEELLINPPTS